MPIKGLCRGRPSRSSSARTAAVWRYVLVLAGLGAVPAGPAGAGSKTSAPSRPAPAVHFSAPAHAPAMGGAIHVPGSMAGGAHLPGGMAGGAHLPSSMARPGGGAHLPSNMAGSAHLPASMAGAAHVPGSMAGAHMPGGIAHGPAQLDRTAGGERAGPPASPGGVTHDAHDQSHAGSSMQRGDEAHESGGRAEGAEAARRSTPTIMRSHGRLILAGAAVGAGGAMMAHEARPYLHPELRAQMARPAEEVERDRAFIRAHQGDFHTARVRDFDRHELEAWRRGRWRAEWHYGRRGWWWETGGVWYPYADPVFPYPLVVAGLVAYDTTQIADPDEPEPDDGSAMQPGYAPGGPPSAGGQPTGIPPLPAPPPGWYRCADPAGYFPSVGACNGPWTLVQEAPPDAGP